MSILKALQKRQTDNTQPGVINPVVLPPETDGVTENRPPELFTKNEFRIGSPIGAPSGTERSTFNGQSVELVGKALPEQITERTAGATLSVVNSTRTVVQPIPKFVSWSVEPERVEPRLVTITHPNSAYCEEYRSLRTQILHRSQRSKTQSIVIASANPGEGKSVTSLNLAWLLAQTDGVRCLIIDADLRLPSLAEYIGIETDKGLSDILTGDLTLEEAIIRLEPSGLHLLPGGQQRNDVAELISGPKFRALLASARAMFDFILIDAPPIGIFTDAAVLTNHADAAILVVRANRTKTRTIERVLDSVPRDRLMGVVLNQSDDVLNESQYRYGTYSYRYNPE